MVDGRVKAPLRKGEACTHPISRSFLSHEIATCSTSPGPWMRSMGRSPASDGADLVGELESTTSPCPPAGVPVGSFAGIWSGCRYKGRPSLMAELAAMPDMEFDRAELAKFGVEAGGRLGIGSTREGPHGPRVTECPGTPRCSYHRRHVVGDHARRNRHSRSEPEEKDPAVPARPGLRGDRAGDDRRGDPQAELRRGL